MILTIRHSGKGKIIEMIKRSVVGGEGGEYIEHRGFSRQWKYYV